MTIKDFIEVAELTDDIRFYDPSGMLQIGCFNSFYTMPESWEKSGLKILSVKSVSGSFSVRVDIDETEARKLKKENDDRCEKIFAEKYLNGGK